MTVVNSVNTASAQLLKRDTTTEGNWMGVYGSKGYNVINNAVNYPAYATVSTSGAYTYTWAATSTDPRALEDTVGSSRVAACWYSPTSFSINVNFTDGQTHDLALYALDWDKGGRSEQIQITSAPRERCLTPRQCRRSKEECTWFGRLAATW